MGTWHRSWQRSTPRLARSARSNRRSSTRYPIRRSLLTVVLSLLLLCAVQLHGQPASASEIDCSSISDCLSLLPTEIRQQIADELQLSIDNVVAECDQSIDHVRAECARAYEPQLAELGARVERLEAELRDALAVDPIETWVVFGVLAGVFAVEMIIDPGWDDTLTLAAAGAWLGWRYLIR